MRVVSKLRERFASVAGDSDVAGEVIGRVIAWSGFAADGMKLVGGVVKCGLREVGEVESR